MRRDDDWLQQRVESIWQRHFADAPTGFPITARFGSRARFRFGSIYSRDERCHLLVNGLFAHAEVPDYVVDATIAHELAHYVHGYGSGLRRLHYSPHRGGVVDRELDCRGLGGVERLASAWRVANWPGFFATNAADTVERRDLRARRDAEAWRGYLSTPGFRTAHGLRERARELAARLGVGSDGLNVDWLAASRQRTGVSFYFHDAGEVRLHGLLADPSAPQHVVDFELMYWLATLSGRSTWASVHAAIRAAHLWARAERAIAWRRKAWPGFLRANHPLRRP